MFGLGHWEIILILVIVLIFFGAGKLPKVSRQPRLPEAQPDQPEFEIPITPNKTTWLSFE